jgi:hypothetical protein
MKNTTFFAVCVLLLLGGLFCLHLAAQSGGPGGPGYPGAIVFDTPLSLLDPKVSELSERELLEMKVDRCRRIVIIVKAHAAAGNPAGRPHLLAEAQANLADAEIELYRYTNEQDKLLVALDAKVKALTDKVRAVVNSHNNGTVTMATVCEAEVQLLDALLERKRARSK